MQKFHTLLAWLLLFFLALHLVVGSITVATPIHLFNKPFTTLFMLLTLLHAVLALRKVSRKKSIANGMAYPERNRLYWWRIFSGLGVLILLFAHRVLWIVETPFGVVLRHFGWPSLVIQLLFTVALAIHVLVNIRPLLIDTGIDPNGRTKKVMAAAAGILLLISAVSVTLYFQRGAL